MGKHPHQVRRVLNERPYSDDTAWGRKILMFLDRLAASDVPVLITGETGVGKEVLARAIHEQSSRASQPFLKLNCAALPPELIESELFGYERGAFTGAYKSTRGKFEAAEGGTILLDEVGDMDLRLQSKLLQVLQDAQFIRVGGHEEISVDVRVIAATHRDLPMAVRQGAFRQDLYYRLNVVSVTVPPLRERVDEILHLIDHFKSMYTSDGDEVEIPPVLRNALLLHTWPGNIRELENTVRKFVVMRQPEAIIEDLEKSRAMSDYASIGHSERKPFDSVDDLRAYRASLTDATAARPEVDPHSARVGAPYWPATDGVEGAAGALSTMDEQHHRAEAEAIMRVLNATLWNRKQAAEILKIDYKALLYKMKKLGLSRRAHGTPLCAD